LRQDEERLALWSIRESQPPSFDSQSYSDFLAAEPQTSTSEAHFSGRPQDPGRILLSLVLPDEGDDLELSSSLASCVHDDCAAVEMVIPAGTERRAAIDAVLASFVCNLHVEIVNVDGSGKEEAEIQALSAVKGEFVAFLTAGDELASGTLSTVRNIIATSPGLQVLYTDEDWLDERGQRFSPRFKTGWDPDAQFGFNFVGRLCVLRRELVERAGGLQSAQGAARHYDLICRVAHIASPVAIRHLPRVLYHRKVPVSALPHDVSNAAKSYFAAARKVGHEAASRKAGEPVQLAQNLLSPFVNRIVWPLPNPAPIASILVPTRDRVDLLRNCVRGVLQETDYPNLELLILDNDSAEPETADYFASLVDDPRVRVCGVPGPFNFSHMNNRGVQEARGDVIVLMNNDIEVIAEDWLREMVSLALRPDTGCVGAKLLYGDRRIQHSGIVLQKPSLAMHAFRLLDEEALGHDLQLAGVRTYSAVTAACLAVRRAVFESVGGFDERGLRVSFNDVDLCLKVDELGYRNVCTPFAKLLHLEGASRDANKNPQTLARETSELNCLLTRWLDRFQRDPFSHPNVFQSWERGDHTRLASRLSSDLQEVLLR
jgi:GT2 family glycosyltransferase